MVAPGPPRATTATAASAARRNIPYGQKAVIQLGLESSGTPLAGKTVNVQLLGRLGWRTQHSVSTDAAGTAQTRVRMASNRTLRGRYAGDTGLLPSTSPPVAIGVRPQVTVAVGARTVAPGDAIRVTGSVAPRKTRAVLTREAADQLGRVGAGVASHGGAAIRAAAHDAADAAAGPLSGAVVGAS